MHLHNAILLATQMHYKQNDKAGEPYILHPFRVMMNCNTEEEKIVGVLHDILEDTDVTESDLNYYGYSSEVVQALRVITKLKGESYETYLKRVKANPLALTVKLNDIADNLHRNNGLADRKEAARLKEKYHKALDYLWAK